MVDKVKPIKLESPSGGGTETDIFPTEVDPSEDYLAAKGLAVENNDGLLIKAVNSNLGFLDPVLGEKELKTLKSINLLLTDQSNPYLQNGSTTFAPIASFIWPGTSHSVAPTQVSAITFTNSANINVQGEMRLFDVTNSVILGTLTGFTGTTPTIRTITTSGWAANPAVIEIQLRRTGNNGNARAQGLQLLW